jgi:hypothetical protein
LHHLPGRRRRRGLLLASSDSRPVWTNQRTKRNCGVGSGDSGDRVVDWSSGPCWRDVASQDGAPRLCSRTCRQAASAARYSRYAPRRPSTSILPLCRACKTSYSRCSARCRRNQAASQASSSLSIALIYPPGGSGRRFRPRPWAPPPGKQDGTGAFWCRKQASHPFILRRPSSR